MIFLFPNLETLRIALTSGMVPPSIGMEPVEASFDADGRPSVKSHAIPPKTMQNALKRLGVKTGKAHYGEPIVFGSWAEILPVAKEAGAPEIAPLTPVLFEMPAQQLASFATEMLRLGNDRQSFRYLADASSENQQVLLRVIGPPYYTLLRTLDRLTADVVAYVEKGPRVWAQINYDHPLAANIKVPEGRLLLLGPPRRWTQLEDAPYQDIYDILNFQMPTGAVDYAGGKLQEKLTVQLRLAPGNAADLPEMWVLKNNAVEVFDAFVRDADERVMARLAFAVAENGETGPAIVLRVRQPSKLIPPAIELAGAIGYTMHRRIQNLFVPAGMRLQPTLPRDAVKKMLAEDDSRVVWLTAQGDGRFVPEAIADEAFRPLADWVDYIIDRERQTLQSWLQAVRFDFDSFVCTGDLPIDPPKPPSVGKPKSRKAGESENVANDNPTESTFEGPQEAESAKNAEEAYAAPVVAATPSEHVAKREELEKAFMSLDGPLEAPERVALWPQLAQVNSALCDYSEAAVCWLNALWERHDLPAAWMSVWFHSEVNGAAAQTPADFERDLAIEMPTQSDMRQLAARLLYACTQPNAAAVLKDRLPAIRRYLEKHDENMGVRAAWLVWLHLTKVSGDVLGLARVRDRLINRLFKNGLKRQHDVPTFIHFAGQRDSNRLRRVQDDLLRFRGEVHHWLERQDNSKDGLHKTLTPNKWFADLIFAFGLAKIGEERNRGDLMSGAFAKLKTKKAVEGVGGIHPFLAAAFEYRIQQTAKGEALSGSLPSNLMESLDSNDRLLMYNVNKMRKHLYIIEPHEKSDPYLAYQQQEELNRLTLILEPQKLASETRRMLGAGGKLIAVDQRLKILIHALPLSIRSGEAFVREMLQQVLPALASINPKTDADLFKEIDLHAKLVDASISLAANYGWTDLVNDILTKFVDNLSILNNNEIAVIESIKKALGQWLRCLRRCGLKDRVEALLVNLTALLLKGRSLDQLRQEYSRSEKSRDWVNMLWALLHLAECWIYFGWKDRALPILQEVREFLFDNEGRKAKNRPIATVYTPLACAYIRAVSQIDDLDFVSGRISELLQKMDLIPNTTTTKESFSTFHLNIVESLVLALVSDDFIMGETARRWLDEDEYLVRRRIHADMKKLLAQTGL